LSVGANVRVLRSATRRAHAAVPASGFEHAHK
jgi:hypothetical protein